MKMNKMGIVVFLVALSLLMGPASATTYINQGDSNSVIQGKLNAAPVGDEVIFESGPLDYTGISLTINKALNLVGNGVTLIGSGSSIFTITGTSGVTINGFNININNTSADGITGSSVTNAIIENNNITNGDDAINIFSMYKNLTIQNNRITGMNAGRDGISLVNHDKNLETTTTTKIRDNFIDGTDYGIFLGGNFNGTISGNTITNCPYGMNITGKHNASLGSLNADIVDNIISGIAMEAPNVNYLNLDGNNISELSSTGYSILNTTYNGIAYYNKTGTISVTNNNFTAPVFDAFRTGADTWDNNLLNGVDYPQW